MTKRQRRLWALAALAAFGSGGTMAQQAGDWQVGAGWLRLAPQDSSKPLTLTSPVPSVVAGSGASVSHSDTLGLNATYFIDSHWAVEGVLGVPPKFKLNGTGTLAQVGELGEARQWSPTVLAKYYFREGQERLRPFVGLGGTYVWYSNVNLTPSLQGAIGSQLHQAPLSTVTTAKLDSSFAPVFNVGVAWQLDAHWGLMASVSYIPLKTKARLTTVSTLGLPVATSEASLKLNPVVPYVALTYKF
jgi:outer membrane protein